MPNQLPHISVAIIMVGWLEFICQSEPFVKSFFWYCIATLIREFFICCVVIHASNFLCYNAHCTWHKTIMCGVSYSNKTFSKGTRILWKPNTFALLHFTSLSFSLFSEIVS